jgi:hypothetical protein
VIVMIVVIALGVALGIVLAPVLLPVVGVIAGVIAIVMGIKLLTRFVAAVVRTVAAGPMWLMAVLADESRPWSHRIGIAVLSIVSVAFVGLMILGTAMPPKYPLQAAETRVTSKGIHWRICPPEGCSPLQVGETRDLGDGATFTRTK